MAGKSGAARRNEGQKQQSGNLGQKEAQQEKRSESELARMGELSKSNDEQNEKDE
ncbi:MAG TPA: hypothetical protein VFL51_03220 [Pseudolabrys sp.]|nr:hypothetical protein [Pseudolabrys sp.]